MSRSLLRAIAVSAIVAAVPAQAADLYLNPSATGDNDYNFEIGRTSPLKGGSTDRFMFMVPDLLNGFLSVALTNTGTGNNNIDFVSATLNGVALSIVNVGAFSSITTMTDIPVNVGAMNLLIVNYTGGSRRATFSGNVAFIALPPPPDPVPEPGTWAMMIFGMGLVGAAFRARSAQRKYNMALSYA